MENYTRELGKQRLLRRAFIGTSVVFFIFLYICVETNASTGIEFALAVSFLIVTCHAFAIFTFQCPRCLNNFYFKKLPIVGKKFIFFATSCQSCRLSLKSDSKAIASIGATKSAARRAFNNTFNRFTSQYGGAVGENSTSVNYTIDECSVNVSAGESSNPIVDIQISREYPDWVTSRQFSASLKARSGASKLMGQIHAQGYSLDFGSRILRAYKNADSKDANLESLWQVISSVRELASICSENYSGLNIDALSEKKQCPYCMEEVQNISGIVNCSRCGVAHHKDCFSANNGCSVFGCASFTSTPTANPPW